LFDTENDLFGDSTPLISMKSDQYIVLPNSVNFDEAVSNLEYNTSENSDVLATINYTYNDVNVGSCDIIYNKSDTPSFDFNTDETSTTSVGEMNNNSDESETIADTTNVIFINVKNVIIVILIGAAAIMLALFILSIIKSYNFSPKGQSHKRRREHKKEIRAAKREAFHKARRAKIQARRDAKARRKKYK
jgi:C4-dicarboxylate-specific signal transduction histidine kinase